MHSSIADAKCKRVRCLANKVLCESVVTCEIVYLSRATSSSGNRVAQRNRYTIQFCLVSFS